MRNAVLPATALMLTVALPQGAAAASQLARMSVSVVATGSDSTRSEGEWSKGAFSYRLAFTTTLETDGELSEINMYDPEYAQKAMAAATANMARIQAAMNGQFSDEEEVVPESRYLLYIGQTGCAATLSMEIRETLEGEYADVGGMQPYTMTFSANSNGSPQDHDMLCVANNSVLDTMDNVLYRSTIGFPEIKGHYVLREANRGAIIDDGQAQHSALPTLVSDYVFNTLRVAPVKGQARATLTATQPVLSRSTPFDNYKGSVEVELTWDFEALP